MCPYKSTNRDLRVGTQRASRTTRRAGASLRAHERKACARARRNPSSNALLVAEFSVPSVLFGVPAGSGRCSLLLLLVHLRVVAAIVTVGRHHHRALSSEGLGHRLALPAAAPTHRTPFSVSLPSSSPRLRQSSASWFVVEYGARALHHIGTVIGPASGANGTVWLSV